MAKIGETTQERDARIEKYFNPTITLDCHGNMYGQAPFTVRKEGKVIDGFMISDSQVGYKMERAVNQYDQFKQGLQVIADLIESLSTDLVSIPDNWNEWDAHDGEEKGAILEDFFLMIKGLIKYQDTSAGLPTLQSEEEED